MYSTEMKSKQRHSQGETKDTPPGYVPVDRKIQERRCDAKDDVKMSWTPT